jgi:hypothetical protein
VKRDHLPRHIRDLCPQGLNDEQVEAWLLGYLARSEEGGEAGIAEQSQSVENKREASGESDADEVSDETEMPSDIKPRREFEDSDESNIGRVNSNVSKETNPSNTGQRAATQQADSLGVARRHQGQGRVMAAFVRAGRWKLLINDELGRVELYDIAADWAEEENLAAGNSGVVKDLRKKILDWQKSVPAQPDPTCFSAERLGQE